MRNQYMIFRAAGYGSGVLGLLLLVLGRRLEPPRPALQAVGGVLLMVMFVSFMVTYVLFMAARLRRRSSGQGPPGARSPGNPPDLTE